MGLQDTIVLVFVIIFYPSVAISFILLARLIHNKWVITEDEFTQFSRAPTEFVNIERRHSKNFLEYYFGASMITPNRRSVYLHTLANYIRQSLSLYNIPSKKLSEELELFINDPDGWSETVLVGNKEKATKELLLPHLQRIFNEISFLTKIQFNSLEDFINEN